MQSCQSKRKLSVLREIYAEEKKRCALNDLSMCQSYNIDSVTIIMYSQFDF